MADALRRSGMTVEELLEWDLTQDERYEPVDGTSVLPRAMAGAPAERDTIVVPLIAALGLQLRGTGCRPRTAGTAVRGTLQRVPRPDVTIACAPVALEARNPIATFEVLSPTMCLLDRSAKLTHDLHYPRLRGVVHIDRGEMDVLVYSRARAGGRDTERLGRPEGVARIPDSPVAVTLATLDDGVPIVRMPRGEDRPS